MFRRIADRWPLQRSRNRLSQGPETALFQGLRVRLTLWYCGVLGTALLLFGIALYFGTQFALLTPIENDTAAHAQQHVKFWINGALLNACPFSDSRDQPGSPPASQGFFMPEMVMCFDQNGSLLQGENTTAFPSTFLNASLAKTALQEGNSASDIVDAGGSFGKIYRYAQIVPNLSGNGAAGVVVIGERIQVQEGVLSLLLTLLLGIGGVALFGAGLGGLFLANRALAPARIAWTHQQRFIADASHELRTPLTLMRADAEVLLRGRQHLDEEDVALLEDIVSETNHMSKLANNMLTLARLDNRSSHQEHEVINLTDVAHAGTRRIQALADQMEISLVVEANKPIMVIGDPTLLEQATLALLDNAIKYNRRGGSVTVQTRMKNEQAYLEISDTGIGIANEHLSHLGERFYRVDKARSREAGGTGLGLSIVQGIAATHNGTLSLTSTPDQGTTAILILPLAHGALLNRTDNLQPGTVSSQPEQTR